MTRLVLGFVLVSGFVFAANLMFIRAGRFAKDPATTIYRHQAWRASTYTDQGQPYRLAAIRFSIFGVLGLAAALWLLFRL